MSSQPVNSIGTLPFEANSDGASNISMEVNRGRASSSDGCPFPESSPSAYHLRSSCSLPLSTSLNGSRGVPLEGHQVNAAVAERESTFATFEREGRADKVRTALKSLRINLSTEIMSKVCASDKDVLPVQEWLLGADVGNCKEEDKSKPRPWKHDGASEVMTRRGVNGEGWLEHDHLAMGRRNDSRDSTYCTGFSQVDEKCPGIAFIGAKHL